MKNVTKQECNTLGFQQNPKNKSLYTYKLDDNGRCLNVEFAKEDCISLYVYNSFTGIVFGLGEFTEAKPLSLDMLKLFVSSFGSLDNLSHSDTLDKTKEILRNHLLQIYRVAKTKMDAFDVNINIALNTDDTSLHIESGRCELKKLVGYNDLLPLTYEIEEVYEEIFGCSLDSNLKPLELAEEAFKKLCLEVSQMLMEISKNDSCDEHSTHDSSVLLDFLLDISQYPLPYTFNKNENINKVLGSRYNFQKVRLKNINANSDLHLRYNFYQVWSKNLNPNANSHSRYNFH
jgi:hypothetical protein